MKKILLVLLITMLLLPGISQAATSNQLKQDWLNAIKIRMAAEADHKEAKLDYATDKSDENEQAVIDTGKEVLEAALDEAEAWLGWKKLEAQENPNVPDTIQTNIETDVKTNLAKIDTLRTDVKNIDSQLNLGTTFLKMIKSYLELLTDVARNSGSMWVSIGNDLIETAKTYEQKIRAAAEKLPDSDEIINKLNVAKTELQTAQDKVDFAESSYKQVKLPGTPLIKFSEGNNYLRQAKTNLLNAQQQLEHAFNLITK